MISIKGAIGKEINYQKSQIEIVKKRKSQV